MKKHSLSKKLLACSLSAMMALSMLPATPAFAETTDTNQEETATTPAEKAFTVPKIEEVSFDTTSVDVTTGSAIVTATVKMNTSDIQSSRLDFSNNNNNNYDGFRLYLSPSSEDPSVLKGDVTLDTAQKSGTYTINSMGFYTTDEYALSYSKSNSLAPIPKKLRNTAITVKSSDIATPSDSVLPDLTVTNINVENNDITLNSSDTGTNNNTKVHLTLKGKPNYKIDYAMIYFTSTKENQYASFTAYAGRNKGYTFNENGECTVELTLDNLKEYQPNGTYSVSSCDVQLLKDDDTYYDYWSSEIDQSNWSGLNNPTITIHNSKVDSTAPVLNSLSIDTTTVTSGAMIHLSGNATDEVSGPSYYLNFGIQKENGSREWFSAERMNVSTTCSYEADIFVSDEAIDGIYKIDYISLSDEAGNILYYGSYDAIPDSCKVSFTVNTGNTEDPTTPSKPDSGNTSGGNTSGGSSSSGSSSGSTTTPATQPGTTTDNTTGNDTQKPDTSADTGIAAGETKTVSGATYKAITAADGTAAVSFTAAKKSAKNVTVPSKVTINGVSYPVVSVSANAFKNNTKVEKVVLPASVKTISKNAFAGAKNLKVIKIKGTSLTKIAKNAFKGISSKAVIKIPKAKKSAYTKLLKKAGYTGKIATY